MKQHFFLRILLLGENTSGEAEKNGPEKLFHLLLRSSDVLFHTGHIGIEKKGNACAYDENAILIEDPGKSHGLLYEQMSHKDGAGYNALVEVQRRCRGDEEEKVNPKAPGRVAKEKKHPHRHRQSKGGGTQSPKSDFNGFSFGALDTEHRDDPGRNRVGKPHILSDEDCQGCAYGRFKGSVSYIFTELHVHPAFAFFSEE